MDKKITVILHMLRDLTSEETKHLFFLQKIGHINMLQHASKVKGYEEYSEAEGIIIYISDDYDFLKRAKNIEMTVIACIDEQLREREKKENKCILIRNAVESLTALDRDYLEAVYCRRKGIPRLIIMTDRLIIRELCCSDRDALMEIYDSNEKSRFFEAFYDNKKEAEVFLKNYIETVYDFYGYGIWGICLNRETSEGRCGKDFWNNAGGNKYFGMCNKERIIGIIGFTPRKDALELGYALTKEYQGKGYISEARRAVTEYARDKLDERNILEITNH